MLFASLLALRTSRTPATIDNHCTRVIRLILISISTPPQGLVKSNDGCGGHACGQDQHARVANNRSSCVSFVYSNDANPHQRCVTRLWVFVSCAGRRRQACPSLSTCTRCGCICMEKEAQTYKSHGHASLKVILSAASAGTVLHSTLPARYPL